MGEFPNKETQFKPGEVSSATPEQKSAGWAKKRTLKELLNLCLIGDDQTSIKAREALSTILKCNPDELKGMTFEEVMDLRQIQRAWNDSRAWKAIKDVVYGSNMQITGKDGSPLQVVIKVTNEETQKLISDI